jgi:hypothetical protein
LKKTTRIRKDKKHYKKKRDLMTSGHRTSTPACSTSRRQTE